MALLTIDSKTLELKLMVGVLEEYKPNKEIKDIYKLSEKLKVKTTDKIKQLFGDINDQKEIIATLNKQEEKKKEWTKFLEKEYNVDLTLILDKIRAVNRLICPDYEGFINEVS